MSNSAMGDRSRIRGWVALAVCAVLLVGVYVWNDHRASQGPSKRDVNQLLTCVTGPHPDDC